jgi:hypothetical protein
MDVQASQEETTGEATEEHEKARIPRDQALGLIHQGGRYSFGYGPENYGIWDAASSATAPIQEFPPTEQGRQEGWSRFLELEPEAAEKEADVAPPNPDRDWRREVQESRKRSRRRNLTALGVIVVVLVGGILFLTLTSGGGGGTSEEALSEAAKAKKAQIEITGATPLSEELTQTEFTSTPLESLVGASNKGVWEGTTVTLTIDIHNPQEGTVSTTVIPPRTVIIEIAQADGTSLRAISTNGECKVTMDEVSDAGFSGSYECTGMPVAGGEPLDATGTFGAST